MVDLNHFLEELDDGIYIHQTLETVFADMEGKQLLVSHNKLEVLQAFNFIKNLNTEVAANIFCLCLAI